MQILCLSLAGCWWRAECKTGQLLHYVVVAPVGVSTVCIHSHLNLQKPQQNHLISDLRSQLEESRCVVFPSLQFFFCIQLFQNSKLFYLYMINVKFVSLHELPIFCLRRQNHLDHRNLNFDVTKGAISMLCKNISISRI